MEPIRDLAIVLRSVPYEERHRVVTALTENHGLISALARNSIQSRRFGGTLEPFAASEWLFVERPGAELFRVQEAHIRRAYEGLRKDFRRLSIAGVFNEFMLKVAPVREPCPELFKLHSNALAALEEISSLEEISVLNAYFSKMLQWSGNQPQLQNCLGCETSIEQLAPTAEVSCVISDAGWVCPSCRAINTRHVQNFQNISLRISPRAIQDFQMSLNVPIRQVPAAAQASENEQRELFKYLDALVIYHLPGFDRQPLKSLRFLDLQSIVPPEAKSRQYNQDIPAPR